MSDDLEKLWNIYNEYCASDRNQLHVGALGLLKEFANTFKYGILTSSSEKRVGIELSELGLPRTLLVEVQTSEHTKVHKPNPLFFEPICKTLANIGVSRSEILYVGDAVGDYTAATGFGLQFIGMAHTEREKKVFSQKSIEYLEGFAQLADFLRSRQT